MKTKTTFQDGWYAVYPEGGCYEAVEIRDNEIVDRISESQAGSHRAGQNWHYIPVHDAIDATREDDPKLLDEAAHSELVRMIDEDWAPSCVAIERLETQ